MTRPGELDTPESVYRRDPDDMRASTWLLKGVALALFACLCAWLWGGNA